MMRTIHLKRLIVNLAIPLLVGLISSFLSFNVKEIYEGLIKPPFAPPASVFPVVWTALYILMGMAAYLVSEKPASEKFKARAMRFYYISLFLNALWSPVFFTLGFGWLALLILVLMWFAILLTAILFREINRFAGLLMVPYLLWVAYAGYLNVAINCLN